MVVAATVVVVTVAVVALEPQHFDISSTTFLEVNAPPNNRSTFVGRSLCAREATRLSGSPCAPHVLNLRTRVNATTKECDSEHAWSALIESLPLTCVCLVVAVYRIEATRSMVPGSSLKTVVTPPPKKKI